MTQPLEYRELLLADRSASTNARRHDTRAAQCFAVSMLKALQQSCHLEILAYGGQSTVYPRELAMRLVAGRGVACSARVRNLAIDAVHGAAIHALCCETLEDEERGSHGVAPQTARCVSIWDMNV